MGRSHEIVNKVESLFGMRSDMAKMDQVSTSILNQIEDNRQNFGTLQQHFKKFFDDTSAKQNQAFEINRLLSEVSGGAPAVKVEAAQDK